MKTKLRNIEEYLNQKFEYLDSSANLIVILDPNKLLDLEDKFVDTKGKTWHVLKYNNNDFTFRKEYTKKSKDSNWLCIVLVTMPDNIKTEKLNVSYVVDILSRADDIFDMNLGAVLTKLFPKEKWPKEIYTFADEIATDLSKFTKKYDEFRKERPDTSLGKEDIHTLLLSMRYSHIPIEDLIFSETNAEDILVHYIQTALRYDFNEHDFNMLKEIVRNSYADASRINSWLELDQKNLSTFLYLMHLLDKYEVINPLNQLRGVGILNFDPTILKEELIKSIMHVVNENPDILSSITNIVEKYIHVNEMYKVVRILPLKEPKEIAKAIIKESSPLFVYALISTYLERVTATGKISPDDIIWGTQLQTHPVRDLQTVFSVKAQHVISFLYEISLINEIIIKPYNYKEDFTALITWYYESKAYILELVLARANKHIKDFEDSSLKKMLMNYVDNLKTMVRKYIEQADLNLASLIEKKWNEYISHPRLAINILRDNIIKRNIVPTDKKRVWILLFDGVRLDTWEEIIKPIIANKFELEDEKLYFCLLPSFTQVARIALLAGTIPTYWKDYGDKYTIDHNILFSRLFGISRQESRNKTRIIISSETDWGQRKINDVDTKYYNVLIYNLSDDWIHGFKDDVDELNETIKNKLIRGILPDIINRIGDEDYVIMTSDHGFIELAKEDEIKVSQKNLAVSGYGIYDDKMSSIAYRHLENIVHKSGIKIQYHDDVFFTVAKGHMWFGRERGKFTRYTHGGISMSEMIVPGALLKKSIISIIKFELKLPETIDMVEDKVSQVDIRVINVGNAEETFNLTIRTNLGATESTLATLKPKETFHYPYMLTAKLGTKSISVELTYRDKDKKNVIDKKIIPVNVAQRKDKVEFDLGGLDKIEL